MSIRVWRRVAGASQALFAFVGNVDATALAALLQQVRRLICALPGRWRVDVVAVGFDDALMRAIGSVLCELQEDGHWPRLTLALRLRSKLCTLSPPPRLEWAPPTLH